MGLVEQAGAGNANHIDIIGSSLEDLSQSSRLSAKYLEGLRRDDPLAYKDLMRQIRIQQDVNSALERGEDPAYAASIEAAARDRHYRNLFMGIGEEDNARRQYYPNAVSSYEPEVEEVDIAKREKLRREPPPCPTKTEARDFGGNFAHTINKLTLRVLNGRKYSEEASDKVRPLLDAYIKAAPIELINDFIDVLSLPQRDKHTMKNRILDLKAELKANRVNGKKIKRSLTTNLELTRKKKTKYEKFRQCVYNLTLLVKEHPSPALRAIAISTFAKKINPDFVTAFIDHTLSFNAMEAEDPANKDVLVLKPDGGKSLRAKSFNLWDLCAATIGHSLQSMVMPVYEKIRSTQESAENKKRDQIFELRAQANASEKAIDESLKVLIHKLPRPLITEIARLIRGTEIKQFDELYNKVLENSLDLQKELELDPYIKAYAQITPGRNLKPEFYRAYAEDFVSRVPIKALRRFIAIFNPRLKLSKRLYDRLRSDNPDFKQILLPENLITSSILPSDLFKKLNSVIEPHIVKLDKLKKEVSKLSAKKTNVDESVKPLESRIDKVAKSFVSLFPSSFIKNIVASVYSPQNLSQGYVPPLNWGLDQRIDEIKNGYKIDSQILSELGPLSRLAMSVTKDGEANDSLTASFLSFMQRTPRVVGALFKTLGLRMPDIAKSVNVDKAKFEVLVQSSRGLGSTNSRKILLEEVTRAMRAADKSNNSTEKDVLSQFVNRVVRPDREERRLAEIGLAALSS